MFTLKKSLVMPIFVCSFLLLLSGKSHAQDCPPPPLPVEQARDRINNVSAKNAGLLWKIEKAGRVSWLYGTMHFMHIDFAKPGAQIMMGMRMSDALAVELNVYEPQQAVIPPTIKFELSTTQLERLLRAYQKDCIKADPKVFFASPLLTSQAQRQQLFWGYSPDVRLMQIAQRTSKPIIALESIAQQIRALTPSSQAEFDDQLNSSLDHVESGKTLESLASTAKAWQTSDLSAFVQAEQVLSAKEPAFIKRLNDDRNIAMAEKIDSLHSGGKRLFVAVGALHMTGKNGLPQLLQDKGYTLSFIQLRN